MDTRLRRTNTSSDVKRLLSDSHGGIRVHRGVSDKATSIFCPEGLTSGFGEVAHGAFFQK
ncbi:MAG TPA: hypothetical protein PK156_21770 [Polyangium sp.]|nr:hypothetical protein [Polyangium sp.]